MDFGWLFPTCRVGLVSSGPLIQSATIPNRRPGRSARPHPCWIATIHLGILHAGDMLDRAEITDRNIESGATHLAGLADLPVVGCAYRSSTRPRGRLRRHELVGERSIYLAKIPRRLCMARPPDTMILADVSVGRSLLATSSPTKLERPGIGCGAAFSTGRCRPSPSRRRWGPHGDDLLGILRLHGRNRVTRLDRPLQRIRRNHLDAFRHLITSTMRRRAGITFLNASRGRDEVVHRKRQRHDQGGQRLVGSCAKIGVVVRQQHLFDYTAIFGPLIRAPLAVFHAV